MLLIILLGVITKLVLVSADCHIGNITRSYVGKTNYTGTWYWIYHTALKHNEDMGCAVSKLVAETDNFGTVKTYVYIKSTKTLDRFTGTLVDWNHKGYYDLYYTEPSGHTNCAADEGCAKNPHYAGIWTGRWELFSHDLGRYLIVKNCRSKQDIPFIYIAFRAPKPDEEILNTVKKHLKQNGVDFNQLLKWETSKCENI